MIKRRKKIAKEIRRKTWKGRINLEYLGKKIVIGSFHFVTQVVNISWFVIFMKINEKVIFERFLFAKF